MEEEAFARSATHEQRSRPFLSQGSFSYLK
jgi:hypothetical protein